ncbi:MAG: hypothetical protein MSA53_06875 [Bacteroidales bacterium]|nr:hypothetical protein [Bacteroidales bacterium]MDD5891615.1 hypothetical protein [Bacteroidales bacterium]MDY5357428.1 hypothetical protein [Candidatus Cryptobacteroides sp.]
MTHLTHRFILALSLIVLCFPAFSQDGTYGSYSPYSIYGIGDISKEGTAFNKSMGGVGIATRNRRFINILNPASVTARDTLAFMADFGIYEKNTAFRQGDVKSAKNTFNVYDFVMSFPIWRSSAFMVGITPFSDMGYDFSSYETDKDIIGNVGNINYDSSGNGSVYQVFLGAGVTFWKRLSVGAELLYYFGNLDKTTNMEFVNTSYRSINNGHDLTIRGLTGKFGLQYEQKLGGNISMVLGATYRLGTNMKGYSTTYSYAIQSSVTDTLKYSVDTLSKGGVRFGDELGVGISIRGGEQWSAEFNYLRSDWRKSGFDSRNGFSLSNDGARFSSAVSQSFRAGFEIVPNRNDIRYYFRRCAYRAGVYFDQSYYKLDGNSVNSVGITLGITLPVFRWYNGISIGVDMGQRASTRNNMIRERYAMFVIGFNIHDIWFQKPRYN